MSGIAKKDRHYLNKSAEYRAWQGMKGRCYNPKRSGYKNYGGRGIVVCKKWIESFSAFYKDIGKRPTNKHSLERINNEKGYFKSNCRWALKKDQTRNTRRTNIITFKGRRMCLTDWAKELNIHHTGLRQRIKLWGLERALTTPRDARQPFNHKYRRKNIDEMRALLEKLG